jgi:NADH-quinone oxidoreductase subunit M
MADTLTHGLSPGRGAEFEGAPLVMIAHGLYSGLLFSIVGLVYDGAHVREVGMMSGLVPFIATVFMLAGLASLGLPGLAERLAVGPLAAATLLIGVGPNVVADMSAGGVAPVAAAVAQGGRR